MSIKMYTGNQVDIIKPKKWSNGYWITKNNNILTTRVFKDFNEITKYLKETYNPDLIITDLH